jgi:hypothetical protein
VVVYTGGLARVRGKKLGDSILWGQIRQVKGDAKRLIIRREGGAELVLDDRQVGQLPVLVELLRQEAGRRGIPWVAVQE